MTETAKQRQQIARRLYRVMPGAQTPPVWNGEYMWGEIDATDEWAFCEAIADEIVAARAEGKAGA